MGVTRRRDFGLGDGSDAKTPEVGWFRQARPRVESPIAATRIGSVGECRAVKEDGPAPRVLSSSLAARGERAPTGIPLYTAQDCLLMRLSSCCFCVVVATAAGPGALGTGPDHPAVVETADAIRLHGVVTQRDAGLALLQFGEGRPLALRVGESHGGFTVLRLFPDSVRLKGPDGETVSIDLPDSLAPPRNAEVAPVRETPGELPPPVATPPNPEPVAPGPALVDERTPAASRDTQERTFSRDDVRLRLQSELPRILSSAVVAPRVLGTEVVGLELVAFPADTVLGDTGLVAGDVLLAVNGREVRGAESLAVLVQRFQTASRIEITVDRGGEVFLLRYRIE